MSEDISCAITPPNSPGPSEHLNDTFYENNFEGIDSLDTHSSFRWFSCLGEAKLNKISVHGDGYLSKGEEHFFKTVAHKTYWPKSGVGGFKGSVHLFGHCFDKGSAILYNCKLLFKMVRSELMMLENASKLNTRVLGSAPGRSLNKDYGEVRRNCISFFLYIRDYLSRISERADYSWIIKELVPLLAEQMAVLRLLLRQITHLPDYIINHAANALGNKCSQPAHHLFHCHLDLRWLHVTTVATLAVIKTRSDVAESQSLDYGSVFDQRKCVNDSTLEHAISLLVSDLILLAIARFEKIESQDLLHKSVFSCSCVAELWILVQYLTDDLEARGKSKGFWSYVNRVVDDVLNSKSEETPRHNCSTLHRPATYGCTNPQLFAVYLIKHLAFLYSYKGREMKSNYPMLEVILKAVLSAEIQESQLRTILSLLQDLLLKHWEPRTETVIVLWEYFHKRLNSTFYLAGTSLESMGIVSKSALGLVTQVMSRLEDHLDDRQNPMDSFHMFIKILGLHLRRTSSQERHWKQLRGRIYSKLSASKMIALSETGMYHFVSLFLTMAVSADLLEVTGKLQHFLGMITETGLDLGRRQVVWRAQLAACILLAERGHSFANILTPLYQKVEVMVTDLKSEHALPLMRTFVEAVQDILDCNERITSSHHLLFGSWISRYLADCPSTDASRLLDAILLVITRLRNQSFDSANLVVQDSLWDHLAPYIRTKSSDDSAIYQVADIAFGLSILSLNASNSQERFKEMFNIFVNGDVVDVRLTRRFLCQMIQNKQFPQTVNHNKLITKAWLRCLTLSTDGQHTELQDLTKYVVNMPGFLLDRNITSAQDSLLRLFTLLANKYNNAKDIMEKGRLREDVSCLFEGMDRWLRPAIKLPRVQEQTSRVYFIVGKMVHDIPYLLYTKSKPNSILKTLLDLLLLPLTVHNPEYKLHPFILCSITTTLHLYIEGLMQLGPQQDPYISRTVRELITLYLPRCIGKPGSLAATSPGSFSLVHSIKCDDETSKTILETINTIIIKKKAKTPHVHCPQALKFLSDTLSLYRHDTNIVTILIKYSLDCLCDVIMFCEDNMCKRQARDITFSILNCDVIRLADRPGEELMSMFSRLCREYLAFSSRQLFDLFHDMLSHGPDLVARFMPTLLNHVKEVENKRGVGYDRSLRMGVERLDMAMKSVRK